MSVPENTLNLTGQLLVAMPSMLDPRFAGCVIYMCAHSSEGAMGLIVNKPAQDVSVSDILSELNLQEEQIKLPVHFGGPVEHARGFVLHSPEYASDLFTLAVDDRFSMTGTIDVLEDIACNRGPRHALLMLGYAGWGPDQLETEIMSNGWLTCSSSPELVFSTANDMKWVTALEMMGIDPVGLSGTAGRA